MQPETIPCRTTYQPPKLEIHHGYTQITGISLPIGTTGLEPINDFMEGEQ
jgi:hypothetical protein